MQGPFVGLIHHHHAGEGTGAAVSWGGRDTGTSRGEKQKKAKSQRVNVGGRGSKERPVIPVKTDNRKSEKEGACESTASPSLGRQQHP